MFTTMHEPVLKTLTVDNQPLELMKVTIRRKFASQHFANGNLKNRKLFRASLVFVVNMLRVRQMDSFCHIHISIIFQ
jgi:hypothetical protein